MQGRPPERLQEVVAVLIEALELDDGFDTPIGATSLKEHDDVDGLYDPTGYLRRLQKRIGEACGRDWPRALYLVVEKISLSFEHLPLEWPVHGETGSRSRDVSWSDFGSAAWRPSHEGGKRHGPVRRPTSA